MMDKWLKATGLDLKSRVVSLTTNIEKKLTKSG